MIEHKDILNWCFTVGALNFGVFGFLYTTYAFALSQVTEDAPLPPPIVYRLKWFCRAVSSVLVVLTVLAIITGYNAGVGLSTWLIVLCFIVLAGTTVFLSLTMG